MFTMFANRLYTAPLSKTTIQFLRLVSSNLKPSPYTKAFLQQTDSQISEAERKLIPKIIYNTLLEEQYIKLRYKKSSVTKVDPREQIAISLKYFSDDIVVNEEEIINSVEGKIDEGKLTHFPYGGGNETNVEEPIKSKQSPNRPVQDVASDANEEIRRRYELQKEMGTWMTAYDNYDDNSINRNSPNEEDVMEMEEEGWKINYGNPDPNIPISNTPCGGCGALLHCKDTAIPGYIPSEIFKNSFAKGSSNLEAITCQRCHFLKHYNIALQTRVSPEDYPKILQTISQNRGVVLLMVDLLDFPCSIWPGIADIFGSRVPIVVVGNKVDLLPKDSKGYLEHIKRTLLNNVKLCGFAAFNIKHIALISAKTGFGVEDLITQLLSLYKEKGNDVYIVGNTNVGKSTLFNALLQSDYCKVQAIDLIQRATTSIWPGTTLNLLKFPIKRPAGLRQYLRHKRLMEAKHTWASENELRKEQLRKTKDPQYATLIGHIDVTKHPHGKKKNENMDHFSVQGTPNASGKFKMGIDEKSLDYVNSRWCFDTPGVVQPDQIIHLLTTEELLLTLPKELIIPRTFCLKPQTTLFIAGLSRLDYLQGPGSVKLTVFSSNELPVTVCNLLDAEDVYQNLLGSHLFKVPMGNSERLLKWPQLEQSPDFTITGKSWTESTSDVVLSNSGWIALTGRSGLQYTFRAWTPQKRGFYLRDCLLPHAVALAGNRISHSISYGKHKFFLR